MESVVADWHGGEKPVPADWPDRDGAAAAALEAGLPVTEDDNEDKGLDVQGYEAPES